MYCINESHDIPRTTGRHITVGVSFVIVARQIEAQERKNREREVWVFTL